MFIQARIARWSLREKVKYFLFQKELGKSTQRAARQTKAPVESVDPPTVSVQLGFSKLCKTSLHLTEKNNHKILRFLVTMWRYEARSFSRTQQLEETLWGYTFPSVQLYMTVYRRTSIAIWFSSVEKYLLRASSKFFSFLSFTIMRTSQS